MNKKQQKCIFMQKSCCNIGIIWYNVGVKIRKGYSKSTKGTRL